MGNRKNRRTRRTEPQSPNKDENMPETSLLQGNATLTNVSENVNNVFDRNLGSELTEPSQISNEIETITQRLSEQNNNKLTQIEHQLNSKFEEILKEIRTNKNYNVTTDEEDAESRQPGPSYPKTKGLRSKHASNMTIERDQDDRFYSSEMSELRQPYTPIGIAIEILDEAIIINENRQENADYHMMIGGLGIADHHNGQKINSKNTARKQLCRCYTSQSFVVLESNARFIRFLYCRINNFWFENVSK